ncbi:uncharacterized protein LOC128013112 [Carassius gibelio]|uniref:uncharacterized protein LOC128013112 n=1 Tax=Carassius gibelio TaxID=101364 RepID=UPI002277FE3B|nr:uncharacterized protein LOC128013112 [Carassius gibelio]
MDNNQPWLQHLLAGSQYRIDNNCQTSPPANTALCGLNGGIQMRPFLPPSPKSVIQMNNSSFGISTLEMGISDEEWERLQQALDWPGPDQQITQLNLSTSPVHSTFSIVELKQSYKVGDNISVIITARDHNKNLKRYGGDFFKAKLFNSKLKASVYGEVVDHRNGTYSVLLLLPWEGQAQVFVRLEHSSEVVQILKKYRESSFPRSHYNGHFEGPGAKNTKISEVVECNLKWGAKGSLRTSKCCCEYKDIKTGNEWQCERPKRLPCDKMVGHSMGRFESPLNHFENRLFSKKLTNVAIIGDKTIINVLPNTEVIVYPAGQRDKAMKTYIVLDEQSNKSLGRTEFFEHFGIQGAGSRYTLKTQDSGVVDTAGRHANNFIVESVEGNIHIPLPTLIECDMLPDNRSEIPSPELARHHPHIEHLADKIPPLDANVSILLVLG